MDGIEPLYLNIFIQFVLLIKMVVNVLSPQKTITTAKGEKGEMVITSEIVGDKMVSVIISTLYIITI